MPPVLKNRRLPADKRAEMERRLKELRREESHLNERLHKLEASMALHPGAGSRRDQLMLPPEEPADGRRAEARPLRYQRELVNRNRSRQALTALFMLAAGVLLALWLSYQIKSSGLL